MLSINNYSVQQLYLAFFGRPSDPSGLKYWTSLANLKTIEELSYTLEAQDEYQQYITNFNTIEQRIDQIFLNLFNRQARESEISHLCDLIDNWNLNFSQIVVKIIQDDIFLSDKVLSKNDRKIILNKTRTAQIFTKIVESSDKLERFYKPKSIIPWVSGFVFNAVISFMKSVSSNLLNEIEIEREINKIIKPAIEFENVNLRIPIYTNEHKNLKKILVSAATGGNFRESTGKLEIEALKDINLIIMHGERVALIGHNGSGKTSFLRLLSGIYSPTSGRIISTIKVYPMLQKSFLTSQELSGMEAAKSHYLLLNNNLNGFDKCINEIIDFSGLGPYINLPIKSYSEGMCARLMFSILTSSTHECLALDEGLGAGDANFFERAEIRMRSFVDAAGTLFLASHSEDLLKKFCSRGLVFRQGSIVYDAHISEALEFYKSHDYC